MTTKRKGLKKGSLEFLLNSAGFEDTYVLEKSSDVSSTNNSKSPVANPNNTGALQVNIERIKRSPYQPRRVFSKESLQELADSIKAKGLIQPIVVRRINDDYELIAGERRWRAAQIAGLHEVPVVIRQVDDETALVMAIVENIQREDLNPIEESRGLQRLIDEFAMTQQQVADVVGRSRSAVTNLLRLLSLNAEVQNKLESGALEMGHARALLSLDKHQQLELANRIIFKGASVRDAEQWVREVIHAKNNVPKSANSSDLSDDPNIRSLQNRLSETLSANVIINHASNGKGKLVINYHSIDELEGIIAKIN